MKHLILASFLLLGGCSWFKKVTPPAAVEQPSGPVSIVQPKGKCAVDQRTVTLSHLGGKWEKEVTFPVKGLMVTESHYATTEDKFADSRLFPVSSVEGVEAHMDRSCALIQKSFPKAKCADIYTASYTKVWTPPENGKAGQGARGDNRPTPEQELWQGNMMFKWASMPKPGEKWLIRNGDKTVVLSMGFEQGPGSEEWLGGVVPEVHWYLGSNNETQVEMMGPLKDQSVPYGPIVCE